MSSKRWYVSKNKQTHGPMLMSQVEDKIRAGEFTGSDYVIEEGSKEWRILEEIEHFKSILEEPTQDIKLASVNSPEVTNLSFVIPPPDRSKLQNDSWYILVKEELGDKVALNSEGPFTQNHIKRLAQTGDLSEDSFICGPGYFVWTKLSQVVLPDLITSTHDTHSTTRLNKVRERKSEILKAQQISILDEAHLEPDMPIETLEDDEKTEVSQVVTEGFMPAESKSSEQVTLQKVSDASEKSLTRSKSITKSLNTKSRRISTVPLSEIAHTPVMSVERNPQSGPMTHYPDLQGNVRPSKKGFGLHSLSKVVAIITVFAVMGVTLDVVRPGIWSRVLRQSLSASKALVEFSQRQLAQVSSVRFKLNSTKSESQSSIKGESQVPLQVQSEPKTVVTSLDNGQRDSEVNQGSSQGSEKVEDSVVKALPLTEWDFEVGISSKEQVRVSIESKTYSVLSAEPVRKTVYRYAENNIVRLNPVDLKLPLGSYAIKIQSKQKIIAKREIQYISDLSLYNRELKKYTDLQKKKQELERTKLINVSLSIIEAIDIYNTIFSSRIGDKVKAQIQSKLESSDWQYGQAYLSETNSLFFADYWRQASQLKESVKREMLPRSRSPSESVDLSKARNDIRKLITAVRKAK